MANSPLSIRLDLSNGTRFGPGKAALLEQIQVGGSISAAAKQLGMSYPRALKLVEQMNDAFAQPVIAAKHGGASGGGATLTPTGEELVRLYRSLEVKAEKTTREEVRAFNSFINSKRP